MPEQIEEDRRNRKIKLKMCLGKCLTEYCKRKEWGKKLQAHVEVFF